LLGNPISAKQFEFTFFGDKRSYYELR